VAKAAQLGRRGSTASSAVTRSVRESALWVFSAISLIMLLALLTYHPDDPGFSHTGLSSQPLHNQIGAAGAWFADFAFYLCGMPAFLFPAMTMLAGWLMFSARESAEPLDRTIFISRSAGFVLALITSCGLATLHFVHPELRESAGGVLGQLVGLGFESALGLLGWVRRRK
jgi:S-DNA-T family DNA segregation ATPase FtsK/SpoIIIE